MIGIPLFAGFPVKLELTNAALSAEPWKLWIAAGAIVISTILNALYYIPAVAMLFSKNGEAPCKAAKPDALYIVAISAFIALNLFLGTGSGEFVSIISDGLALFG